MDLIDISGQRFGRLVAIEYRGFVRKRAVWLCVCDCGGQIATTTHSLRGGRTKSCGCLRRETTAANFRRHPLAATPEYRIWYGMIYRCTNTKHAAYAYYGGRGITVAQEWRDSFDAFLAEVGRRPSPHHSIDRIDNNRGYEPGNVKWSTKSEQVMNRRKYGTLTFFSTGELIAELEQRGYAVRLK